MADYELQYGGDFLLFESENLVYDFLSLVYYSTLSIDECDIPISINCSNFPLVALTEIGAQGMPGIPGPPGVAGPPGPPGPNGTDVNYVHVQGSAQSIWTVIHNLNKYPSVSIVDSGDTKWEGDIHYDSVNQLTITFTSPFGGRAFLN